MYQQLAHLYDWPGALAFSQQILERDLALFQQWGTPTGSHLLDLACGTGTLSIALAKAGYTVTGLDLSATMLKQAEAKKQTADRSLPVTFQKADMRFFELKTPVDGILCHYDSLNHLSNDSELRATFLQISQALKPGGFFIFDLNTLENYQTFWNGADQYEGPNYRLKTRARFDEALGKATVHYEVAEYTETGLVHHAESLNQHYFTEAAVEKYLMAAGFGSIQYEPFNPVESLPPDFALKTFWHCQKMG